MITCTRKLYFDAAHRVMEHESKCRMLHGHRYTVEATFEARELDAVDRVVDFGVVQELLGGWLDTHWDHNVILHENDRALGDRIAAETGQAPFYLPFNPTAERMAEYLLKEVIPGLFVQYPGLVCWHIRLWETPNSYAEATLTEV
ncbi:MAG: 6-carboxytetrahydropterin synthase [Alphaproteobacteria bacterium]|nr:6-carboxytetrahydropterin synthase [Alphaproteobacteria bacterium]